MTLFDSKFRKYFIGFDHFWDVLESFEATVATSTPPYNVVQLPDGYKIELALAGYPKKNVSIKELDGILNVEVAGVKSEQETGRIYSGISKRGFSIKFPIAEGVKVGKASMEDGMLTIYLEKIEPEKKAAKTIPVE